MLNHSISPEPLPPTVAELERDDSHVSPPSEGQAPSPILRAVASPKLDRRPSDKAYPQQFGRYTLLGRLASGEMADVYVGECAEPGWGEIKRVVIKRVAPHVSEQAGFKSAFFERAGGSKLKHPNVCAVHELSQVDGTHYVAMEYLHGVTLADLIQACKRAGTKVPLPVVVGVIAQACEGLHYAHEKSRRLTHRALSPNKLFVCADGTVKVLDVGIGRWAEGGARATGSSVSGKDTYLSPEQLAGRNIDRRADVWSLGVVLYEALTGNHPFARPSGMESLYAITRDPIAPLSEAMPGASAALALVVSSALHRDAKLRLESAERLRASLIGAVGAANVADPQTIAALLSVFCTATLAAREEMFAGGASEAFVSGTREPTFSRVRTVDLKSELSVQPHATPSESSPLRANMRTFEARRFELRLPSWPAVLGIVAAVILVTGGISVARWAASSASSVSAGPVPSPQAEQVVERSSSPPPSSVIAHSASDSEPRRSSRGTLPGAVHLDSKLQPAGRGRSESASVAPPRKPKGTQVLKANGAPRVGARKDLAPNAATRGSNGVLRIDAAPRTTIFLDGKKLGVAPLKEQTVAAGGHTLRAVTPDGRPKQVQIVIRPGHTLRQSIL